MKLKCNGVFEGGGIKGIAFAGAITELEKAGYTFEHVVGTSAGAIAAVLLAAGYTGSEISAELSKVDFELFSTKSKFGILGSVFNFVKDYGVYSSTYFLEWLEGLLKKKGKNVFGDFLTDNTDEKNRYKCQMIASDITDQNMLILPRDLKQFGLEPNDYPVASAVQMSMSIPFYYEPIKLTDANGKVHFIVDGGILSNYPLWVLDSDDASVQTPTFGFKFLDKNECQRRGFEHIDNVAEYSQSVLSTIMDAHDNYYDATSKADFARTIFISTAIKKQNEKYRVKATDFNLNDEEKAQLYNNGKIAVQRFLNTWTYSKWREKYK